MREIRIDPLTGLRTIIATDRVHRPGAAWMVAPAPSIDPVDDPFAPGNEEITPPEIARYVDGRPAQPGDSPWSARAVPNLFPALVTDAPQPEPHAEPDLFSAAPARGAHEVIVNAPDAVASLADLKVDQVEGAMALWRDRLRAHAGAACRHLIVNERREAGASREHTHAQLFALDFVPALIARERERCSAYAARTNGGNLLADLVGHEVRQRSRLVAYDDEAVLLSPYAARVPYALTLVPRAPRARFEDDGALGAALLHDALSRLTRHFGATPPLNVWLRTAPSGAEHFCWHIDIHPRLTIAAGLELGADVSVNPVSPEDAAAQLRDA